MGAHVSRSDFEWTYTEEPHASRRKEILQKYPEIKKLFGYDPNLKWIVTAMVATQFVMFFVLKDQSWPMIFLVAYCFGGVINHALLLAIHEIAHNLAFGCSRPMANIILGIFANLPIGLPLSVPFKGYHLEHHKYQGDEQLDTDLPTYLEAKLFCTTFGKLIWVMLQPYFYFLRPVLIHPKPPTFLQIISVIVHASFDMVVCHFFGGKILVYMMAGSVMAMGLHPVAGHFISEHYMFRKGFETYSYYGPLNKVTLNVGYHNEHHDFPYIPGSRLPEVKRIAAEYYDNLPQHNSWTAVIYHFIMDPEIGSYARIKRKHRGLAS